MAAPSLPTVPQHPSKPARAKLLVQVGGQASCPGPRCPPTWPALNRPTPWLIDDGSTPWDIGGDAVHVGQAQEEYARALGLTLIAIPNHVAQAVFAEALRRRRANPRQQRPLVGDGLGTKAVACHQDTEVEIEPG